MGKQFLGVVAVWASLFACGASTGDGGKVSDAQQLPKAFAKAVCASFARCCEHQSYGVDLAQCERTLEADLAQELAEYDGLQVRFHADAAQSCIDDYANAACLKQPSEDYDVKRNCNLMFEGLIQPGEPCQDHDECGRTAQCSDGLCTLGDEPAPRGVLGAACGGTCETSDAESDGCEIGQVAFDDPAFDPALPACFTRDGLQCAGSAGARTCQALIAEGGSCAGSSQGCVAGTFCDLETRLCQARTDSGPCSATRDACSANAACDFDAGFCVIENDRNGARCEKDGDCRSGYCNPSSVCQQPFSASSCSQPGLN